MTGSERRGYPLSIILTTPIMQQWRKGICSAGRSPLVWRQWRATLLPTLLGSIGVRTGIRVYSERPRNSVRVKNMRWQLLRRGSRVRGRARVKLDALVASKLAIARAWTLKDCFEYFWHYKSPIWAGSFLDYWCIPCSSRRRPMIARAKSGSIPARFIEML
jgi:hypothetical protein